MGLDNTGWIWILDNAHPISQATWQCQCLAKLQINHWHLWHLTPPCWNWTHHPVSPLSTSIIHSNPETAHHPWFPHYTYHIVHSIHQYYIVWKGQCAMIQESHRKDIILTRYSTYLILLVCLTHTHTHTHRSIQQGPAQPAMVRSTGPLMAL